MAATCPLPLCHDVCIMTLGDLAPYQSAKSNNGWLVWHIFIVKDSICMANVDGDVHGHYLEYNPTGKRY